MTERAYIKAINISAGYRVPIAPAERTLFGKNDKAVTALKKLNFELHPGDRVGVIGRNGCGKSSLLKLLSGVLPARTGRLEIQGEKLSLLNRTSGLIPKATLYENAILKALSLGLDFSSAKNFAEGCLYSADLNHKSSDPLRTLSTGMAGKFNIAINSQVVKPIVIMDEWVGTLDFGQSREDGILERLKDETEILVLASHNEQLVRSLCNKIIVLHDGVLEYFGDDLDFAYERFDELLLNEQAVSLNESLNAYDNSDLPDEVIDEQTHEMEQPKTHLHFINIGRTSIPHLKSELDGREKLEYRVHFHSSLKALSKLPENSHCWIMMRHPIRRFISAFYSRKNRGQPLFSIPWTESERKVFGRFDTVNSLAEALVSDDRETRFLAAKSMTSLLFDLQIYQKLRSLVDHPSNRLPLIRAHDVEDWSKLRSDLEHCFNIDGINPTDPDETSLSGEDWNLSDLAMQTLEKWFSEEIEHFRYLLSEYRVSCEERLK